MDTTAKEARLEAAVVFLHFVGTRRGGFVEKAGAGRVKALPVSGIPTPDFVKLCANIFNLYCFYFSRVADILIILVNSNLEVAHGSWPLGVRA